MERGKKIKLFFARVLILILVIFLAFLIYCKISVNKITSDFHLKGDSKVIINVFDTFDDPGFVAKYKNNDLSNQVTVESNVNTKVVGRYTISYSYYLKYLKMGKTLQRTVIVKDSVKPELNVEGEKEIYIGVGQEYETPKVTASDNYDGDLTSKIDVKSNLDLEKTGIYEINYSVKDSSNNETTDKVVIHVEEKNAYIQISISNQRLDYYEYGRIVLSSDVVTGINNGTPTGSYRVLNKARNVTLVGADYESFVNYWIAFIGHSYGMHDASWRNTFGGNIYRYNGSHGCVNMPYFQVAKLYEMVEIGTPVYVEP